MGENETTLYSKEGVLYRQARPRELEETLLQLVLPAAHREVALRGCHDEVGHLGLECMLDLMHDRFFWPHMATQAKEHIGKCHLCLAFKARQPKVPPQKHCGHTSSRAGPPWLPVSGTWEGPGGEWSSSHRSFHQVCPGICNQDPNCPNDCQNPMGQVHCPLWVTQKDPHKSRMKFQESVGGWPLWADGDMESVDQSLPSANQQPVWKIPFHPDQYTRDLTQGKEVRVEESYCSVGSCIQLHLEFSYRVQPLLSHDWETTSSYHWSSCLVWLHAPSQSQTYPSLFRKSGSAPSGLRRLRCFR